MNPELSVVIPVYDEEESLPELTQWIRRVLDDHDFTFEVIMIDDGSSDSSWEQIVKISNEDRRFKGLRLNRNFGKSAALQTGFRATSGKVVITMDADLQDSPDEIPALYNMIVNDGYQLVSGWKKVRRDPLSKTIPSRLFNYVTRQLSGIKLHDFNCGLKAYAGTVVKNITVYGEMHRYIPLIAKWAGYTRIGEKVVEHRPRKYGRTKYGFRRLITGFLDLASVLFVGRFRQKPMHFFGTIGSVSFLIGFIFTVKLFGEKMYSLFVSGVPVKRAITEQPLFYLALVALIIGSQLFLTGFLAELLSQQAVSKKDYLISEKIGFADEQFITTVPAPTRSVR
ncbi:MAG TPA: glycosyltransferase family 2 protein [Cyclobacteriaceae bacterium]|jgi:glycosyltransferase involved in cell wall biosynthesis|nr:MAG: glycosyltransferase [Bacteroidota bacterium]